MPGTFEPSQYMVDVLIVGGGAAAALAALEARKTGMTVAFVTKESSLVGGATIMSAGGTSAVFSPEDSPEVFLSDILKAGGELNNGKLAKLVADRSTASIYDLEAYDYFLDRKNDNALRTIKQGEGHAYPRGYLDRREALGFCHALSRAVMKNKIVLFPETMVTKLLVKDNRAAGAVAMSLVTGEYTVFNAKAVVLATGGLGALYKLTTNSNVLTGDGFALAFDAGAELVDMEMVQFFPIAFPYPEVRRGKIIGMCSHFGTGVKLINRNGERYMTKYDPERMEMATRDVAARANFTEIKEGRGTKNGAIIVDPREHDPAILLRFRTSVPHIYAMFREVYGEKVAEWQEPFEAIPSQHFFMGGVRINETCSANVAGLFAVGEVAGGVHGANRLSGVALTELFVLGPHAGRAAALFAGKEKHLFADRAELKGEIERLESLQKTGKNIRPFELKASIQSVMWDNLGPVRDGSGMIHAVKILKEIQTKLNEMTIGSDDRMYNRDRMEAAEVPFMIRTALLIASSGIKRQESRGSHHRVDYPERNDDEWLRNIVVKKGKNGDVDMKVEKIIQVG